MPNTCCDPVHELETRADALQHRAEAGDARALERLAPFVTGEAPEHRHALAAIATELGFADWPTALRALTGSGEAQEFGTLLYPHDTAGPLNHWFVRHEEAAATRAATGGYLLGYKRQFFVADRYFVQSLGLDPDSTDWRDMGFDWAHPHDVEARTRMYGRLISHLPSESD